MSLVNEVLRNLDKQQRTLPQQQIAAHFSDRTFLKTACFILWLLMVFFALVCLAGAYFWYSTDVSPNRPVSKQASISAPVVQTQHISVPAIATSSSTHFRASPAAQASPVQSEPMATTMSPLQSNGATQMQQTFLPLSGNAEADNRYQAVIALLEAGNEPKAVRLLTAIVTDFPDYLPARKMLVRLLEQSGELPSARRVLVLGWQRYPDYLPFIEALSALDMQQGKYAAARERLLTHLPDMNQHESYYQALALSDLETDHGMDALELYNELTLRYPSDGKNWMGLGMSLRQLHQYHAAIEAFKKAQLLSADDPELSQSIDDEIGQLKE